MLYKLVCPWSDNDGHTSYASNVSEAVFIFAPLVFGSGWGQAKIAENTKDNSCIVLSPGKRPFKIIQCKMQTTEAKNLSTVVKKQKFDGKLKSVNVDGIVVTGKASRCVGFVAKPKDASFVVNDLTRSQYPNAISKILKDKNSKIGYIDLVKSPTNAMITEMVNKMRDVGAGVVYSFGNRTSTPSKAMLSGVGFSVAAVDDCHNGELSMLMACR